MGVGLNTLAVEGSHEKSFLSIFEEEFKADVSGDYFCPMKKEQLRV